MEHRNCLFKASLSFLCVLKFRNHWNSDREEHQKLHPKMAVLRVGGKHEARGDRNGGLQVPGRTSGSEGQPQL